MQACGPSLVNNMTIADPTIIPTYYCCVIAAAMELVAMELKQAGCYIARTLSYEVRSIVTQCLAWLGLCMPSIDSLGCKKPLLAALWWPWSTAGLTDLHTVCMSSN